MIEAIIGAALCLIALAMLLGSGARDGRVCWSCGGSGFDGDMPCEKCGGSGSE